MDNNWKSPEIITVDGVEIVRTPVRVSAIDGVGINGHTYTCSTPLKRGKKSPQPVGTDLLCIPSELGNFREFHPFALRLLSLPGAPKRVHIITLRGRDESTPVNLSGTDHNSDATDLISFCDALNLHHVDVVISGQAIATIMTALPKRPGLVHRLILNDAAPEFDPVEMARRMALRQRQYTPRNWDEAISNAKDLDARHFPAYGDAEWLSAAKTVWYEKDGALSAFADANLVRLSNAVSYDDGQPIFWKEFKMTSSRPALLIKGEHTHMVSADIERRLKSINSDMQTIIAKGQGHMPQVHMGTIPEDVLSFLQSTPSSN